MPHRSNTIFENINVVMMELEYTRYIVYPLIHARQERNHRDSRTIHMQWKETIRYFEFVRMCACSCVRHNVPVILYICVHLCESERKPVKYTLSLMSDKEKKIQQFYLNIRK